MACLRKRRGKWVVDYRDSAGVRRWITKNTRRECEDELARVLPGTRQASRPQVNSNVSMNEYAKVWLDTLAARVAGKTLKPRTLESYKNTLTLHILPALGTLRVRNITKARIKVLLTEKQHDGYTKTVGDRTVQVSFAQDSLRIILATIRAMLNAAVDDEVIHANPADKLGKKLRLVKSKTTRQEEIKAMNREQLAQLLNVAAEEDPRHYPLFLLLARTGLRIGEALALQWDDLDLRNRTVRVARTLGDEGDAADMESTPKSGRGRDVDLSRQLTRVLSDLRATRRDEQARCKLVNLPIWVFWTDAGTPMDPSKVRRAFTHVLKVAGLPRHFTPHSLRHTFASILLQDGVSPAYVQRQLGHASIKLTVDTYGKWLPMENKAAVDRLDDAREAQPEKPKAEPGKGSSGSSVGESGSRKAESGSRLNATAFVTTGKLGGPSRTIERTLRSRFGLQSGSREERSLRRTTSAEGVPDARSAVLCRPLLA